MSSSFRPDRWILAWVLQTRSRMTGASSFPVPSRPVEERQVTIPTRYGEISGLIYRSPDAIAALHSRSTPPLHIQLHGGGLIGRAIREDEHVSRFLASETGAIILAPHFHAAPQVSFPVAEHQCFDALKWALSAGNMGWNPDRITVGGGGTGAKLAINTAQLVSEGRIRLSGLIATTPVTDVSLPTPGAGAGSVPPMSRGKNAEQPDSSTGSSPSAAGSTASAQPTEAPPSAQMSGFEPATEDGVKGKMLEWREKKDDLFERLFDFAAESYVPDEDRMDPLASPAFDLSLVTKLPRTLIQVGSEDPIADQGRALARRLAKARKPHTLTEYPAGHVFTVHGKENIMEAAIVEQVRFIQSL